MASEFFFSFGRLNLLSLTPKRKEQIKEETRLVETEVVEIFEYGKIMIGIGIRLNYTNK